MRSPCPSGYRTVEPTGPLAPPDPPGRGRSASTRGSPTDRIATIVSSRSRGRSGHHATRRCRGRPGRSTTPPSGTAHPAPRRTAHSAHLAPRPGSATAGPRSPRRSRAVAVRRPPGRTSAAAPPATAHPAPAARTPDRRRSTTPATRRPRPAAQLGPHQPVQRPQRRILESIQQRALEISTHTPTIPETRTYVPLGLSACGARPAGVLGSGDRAGILRSAGRS